MYFWQINSQRFKFASALLVFLPAILFASDEEPQIKIKWYKPEIKTSTQVGKVFVVISGSTTPKTKIGIAGDEVASVDDTGKVNVVAVASLFSEKERSVVADDRGEFELQLHLPPSELQIPIEAILPTNQTKSYQLGLKVTATDVKIANQKTTKSSPYSRRVWSVWGGLGVNLLRYDQDTSIPSSLTLESFDGPTFYGKISRSLNKEFTFQVTANRAPGKTSSSSQVAISQGAYNWTFLTGEFTFFKESWRKQYQDRYSQWGLQWGAQYHEVPFITRSSTTNSTTASVETNGLLLFAIGGTWLYHFGKYLMFESFLRYQVPYDSGSLFDIKYRMAFDGSVGLIYKWKPNWRVGTFWYGQYHEYGISNHKDKYFEANGGGGPLIDGSQKLLFSNLELRLGYEFD